jgi:ABC-type nitrate/sulfonate/bicarbonate transport system substrate-binding protein
VTTYQPTEIRGFYRAGHSTIWELANRAGILGELDLQLVSLEFCDSSLKAEKALSEGTIDFVAGNHISPYAEVARGSSIVCLASPGNSVKDSIVTREPISSLADLRGKRIVDTTILDFEGGYLHIRGNHLMHVKKAGLDPARDVEWLEVWNHLPNEHYQALQMEAMQSGKADATFVSGYESPGAAKFTQAGFHLNEVETLPMITGPTITTSYKALDAKDRLGERLVKALVMAVHYAKTHTDDPQAARMARLPEKPYPHAQAIENAYDLCCMQHPEAAEINPLALWDLHYLRTLDNSGFIDRLYSQG